MFKLRRLFKPRVSRAAVDPIVARIDMEARERAARLLSARIDNFYQQLEDRLAARSRAQPSRTPTQQNSIPPPPLPFSPRSPPPPNPVRLGSAQHPSDVRGTVDAVPQDRRVNIVYAHHEDQAPWTSVPHSPALQLPTRSYAGPDIPVVQISTSAPRSQQPTRQTSSHVASATTTAPRPPRPPVVMLPSASPSVRPGSSTAPTLRRALSSLSIPGLDQLQTSVAAPRMRPSSQVLAADEQPAIQAVSSTPVNNWPHRGQEPGGAGPGLLFELAEVGRASPQGPSVLFTTTQEEPRFSIQSTEKLQFRVAARVQGLMDRLQEQSNKSMWAAVLHDVLGELLCLLEKRQQFSNERDAKPFHSMMQSLDWTMKQVPDLLDRAEGEEGVGPLRQSVFFLVSSLVRVSRPWWEFT